MTRMHRRRFLTIAAASAALPAGMAVAATESAKWQGIALGAPAHMQIAGMSAAEAAPIFAAVEAELSRLENIFSLYRDSALVELNRAGALRAPAPELLEVLSLSDAVNKASGGVFDPSVQPLWLAKGGKGNVTDATGRVGWHNVRFDTSEVAFGAEGMALTLNGVAQGYVTDRVVALLRDAGLKNVLMDMGEVAALGTKSGGEGWKAGVATPEGDIVARVTLTDRALATSAPSATVLAGTQGHIFRPSGAASLQSLASVSAPKAAVADALSTALCLMEQDAGREMVSQFDGARIEALS